MKQIIFAAAVLAMGFLASCGKDSTSSTGNGNIDITGKTKQQVFMMQPWRSISFKDSSSAGIQETFLDCEKDDVYTFKTTTSVNWQAKTKCNAGDPDTADSNWAMADPNGSTVNFMTFDWVIESMTSTNIVLRRRYINNQGADICWRLTLAK